MPGGARRGLRRRPAHGVRHVLLLRHRGVGARSAGPAWSSPLWAALAALADEQGQPSPVGLRSIPLCTRPAAWRARPSTTSRSGNNQPIGSAPSDPAEAPRGPYYPATAGYDLATGLGTPVADALVNRLRAPPPGRLSGGDGDLERPSGPAAGRHRGHGRRGRTSSGVTEVDFGNGNPGAVQSVIALVGDRAHAGVAHAVDGPRPRSSSRRATTRSASTAACPSPTSAPAGYWTVASDGGIFSFGQMGFYGSMGGKPLNTTDRRHGARRPRRRGYWLVASDGGIFAFGDAGFHGSTGQHPLNKPVVGMAATPDGGGYWLVASDGGIFAFGDAGFYGSTGDIHLTKPVVGMAATPDGGGYWLVASDGGIFAFGDAGFYGSTGDIQLNKPVVGMAATPDGGGYWLVASDGGIFAFGDAGFHGSTGDIRLDQPVVGMAATPDGGGYWLVASDGGIFAFGGRLRRVLRVGRRPPAHPAHGGHRRALSRVRRRMALTMSADEVAALVAAIAAGIAVARRWWRSWSCSGDGCASSGRTVDELRRETVPLVARRPRRRRPGGHRDGAGG